MAEKVEQYKVVLYTEFPDITAERVYLTGCSCYKIFFFSIDGFETIDGVALYIFAADGCDSLLGGCGNVMLGTAGLGVVTATTQFVVFFNQLLGNFKPYAAR